MYCMCLRLCHMEHLPRAPAKGMVLYAQHMQTAFNAHNAAVVIRSSYMIRADPDLTSWLVLLT